ncbi:MarC family protein [Arcobacter sp. CECT 8985]|uniref:MarC family protein n=1 Tax=Arcobacter sp. CECT 8985 TaxID=1935424 RepID=UPI00100BE890|nr:MarC family protein [Arcobacter sp. CECT 8985]RXJ86303.1 antibiotic resistance protein MarC [Arcobacter sp. CECT 8985]
MELLQNFLQQTTSLFAIMDPIGVSAMALSLLSPNITKSQISVIAKRSTTTILVAFFVVLITGDFILKLFGIHENSLKVMGGLILLLMAISMVRGIGNEKRDENSDKNDLELAVIPIGIPIAFGTGLFTTIIIFKNQVASVEELISLIASFCINALLFYLVLKNSIYIKKYLGVTGQNIITKLMGLIVGALSIQFIVSGIVSLSKVYM